MSEEAYKKAYERERAARKQAEKLLDEKTREVQANIETIQSQNDDLILKIRESDYLLAIARLANSKLEISDTVREYTHQSMTFLNAKFARYTYKSGGELFEGHQFGYDGELPMLSDRLIRSLYGKRYRVNLKPDTFVGEVQEILFKEHGINRVLCLPITRFGEVTTLCEFYLSDDSVLIGEATDQCVIAGYQVGSILERAVNEKRIAESYEEIKSSHEKLKQTQSQLVHSEKMASLGQLAAGVAHEINNPVGFVMSNIGTLNEYAQELGKYYELTQQIINGNEFAFSELNLLDKKYDFKYVFSDICELVKDMQDGLHRVKDIVSNLRSFARTDDEDYKRFDVNQCIEKTLKVIWGGIKYQVEIHKTLDKTLPMISGREGQISQVIMNMIVNAAQAMEGQGDIWITTKNKAKNIEIQIRDNGKGMPQSVMDKIFDPFFTTKDINQGTGLGLSISIGIIEQHGGTISVESEVQKGTCFSICLPINA